MNFQEIDREFDRAMERLEGRTASSNPYGALPLAGDHFLLKKSWDYFRNRVRTIEEQWRKMLEAKDRQLKSTLAENQAMREETAKLEEENRMMRALDQSIKKARTEDHVGFARKVENLRIRWDAERDALQRKIEMLELKIAQQKKDLESKMAAVAVREAKLRESIQASTKDLAAQAEREREIQRRCNEEIKLKDERIQSLDYKADMLRAEVDRRDAIIKRLESSVSEHEKDAVALTQYVAELQRTLRDRDLDIENQKARLRIVERERDSLREGWERERAEWRELWDRGREAWDKRR